MKIKLKIIVKILIIEKINVIWKICLILIESFLLNIIWIMIEGKNIDIKVQIIDIKNIVDWSFSLRPKCIYISLEYFPMLLKKPDNNLIINI
jgi:hypothetical protein